MLQDQTQTKNSDALMRYVFILIASALMAPVLLGKGMFVDGEMYATFARNMAEGMCTFWQPRLTDAAPVFYDHPPLVFGLQSLFFKVFGDSYLVEKGYSMLTFILSAWLIRYIWIKTTGSKMSAWLPLCLWVLVPLVTWAYANNLLENTMGLFCLGSIAMLLYGYSNENGKLFHTFSAGLLLTAALLSKGPPALFPLAGPLLYHITVRRITLKKAQADTCILVFTPAFVISVLMLWPAAAVSIKNYISIQLLPSLAGKRDIQQHSSRLAVFQELLWQLLPVFAAICTAFFYSFMQRLKVKNRPAFSVMGFFAGKTNASAGQGMALFFLFTAASASLPIFLSPKLHVHYFIAAIPYYALAGGAYAWPVAEKFSGWLQKKSGAIKWMQRVVLAAILGVWGFSFTLINKPVKDISAFKELAALQPGLPRGTTITCSGRVFYNFSLQTYLYRFYHVSLEYKKFVGDYYLADKMELNNVPSGYRLLRNGQQYYLYKRVR